MLKNTRFVPIPKESSAAAVRWRANARHPTCLATPWRMCALARGGWRIQHRHCGARGGTGQSGEEKGIANLFEGETFSVDESFKILSVATRPPPPLCTEARQNWRKQGIVPRSRDLQPNSAIFHGGHEHFHENGGSLPWVGTGTAGHSKRPSMCANHTTASTVPVVQTARAREARRERAASKGKLGSWGCWQCFGFGTPGG